MFCQGICIQQACKEFIDNYEALMNGCYEVTLLDGAETKDMVGEEGIVRKKCIEYAYRNNEVLSLELIGKSVLTSLLDKFIHAVSDDKNYLKPRTESGKLYKLISRNFEYVQMLNENSCFLKEKKMTEHERVQLVIDFISCMTDSYALNLHKILLGMKLP